MPAVGQRPGEAGAAEQGLRAAVSSGAGGRSPGGAGRGPGCESRCRLELGAGGVSSLGGRAGGRRGSAAFLAHGFWERFKPGSSQVEGTVRAQESRHQKRAALRVVPGAERRV